MLANESSDKLDLHFWGIDLVVAFFHSIIEEMGSFFCLDYEMVAAEAGISAVSDDTEKSACHSIQMRKCDRVSGQPHGVELEPRALPRGAGVCNDCFGSSTYRGERMISLVVCRATEDTHHSCVNASNTSPLCRQRLLCGL